MSHNDVEAIMSSEYEDLESVTLKMILPQGLSGSGGFLQSLPLSINPHTTNLPFFKGMTQ